VDTLGKWRRLAVAVIVIFTIVRENVRNTAKTVKSRDFLDFEKRKNVSFFTFFDMTLQKNVKSRVFWIKKT